MHTFFFPPCDNCQPHFAKKTNYCKYCNKSFKPKPIKTNG